MKFKEVLLVAGVFCMLLSVPSKVSAAELAHEQMNDIVNQAVCNQNSGNAESVTSGQETGQTNEGVINSGEGSEPTVDNAGTVNAPDTGTNNSGGSGQQAVTSAPSGDSTASQAVTSEDNSKQSETQNAAATNGGESVNSTDNAVTTAADGEAVKVETEANSTEMANAEKTESGKDISEEDDILEVDEELNDEDEELSLEEDLVDEELLEEDLDSEDEESLVISYTPARGEYKFTEEDIKMLAHLMQHEANGQPLEGKIAVLEVAINRIYSSRFPNTVEAVVYQPGQFSNLRRIKGFEPTAEERAIVMSVINGQSSVLDNSKVLFFRNPWTCIKTKASVAKNWGSRKWFMGIGDHAFYEG